MRLHGLVLGQHVLWSLFGLVPGRALFKDVLAHQDVEGSAIRVRVEIATHDERQAPSEDSFLLLGRGLLGNGLLRPVLSHKVSCMLHQEQSLSLANVVLFTAMV